MQPGRVKSWAGLRLYFVAFALLALALVLAGFSPTFFVPVARRTFEGPITVYVHAAFFLTWVSLLIAQAVLAVSRKLTWHRQLGSISLVLIPAMIGSGVAVSLWATARDLRASQGDAALAYLFGLFCDVAVFAILASVAVAMRRTPPVHKRLMVLATIALLGPALGRIPAIADQTTAAIVALLLSLAVYDLVNNRRVHAATLWCGGGFFASTFVQVPIGATAPWLSIARRIMDLAPY